MECIGAGGARREPQRVARFRAGLLAHPGERGREPFPKEFGTDRHILRVCRSLYRSDELIVAVQTDCPEGGLLSLPESYLGFRVLQFANKTQKEFWSMWPLLRIRLVNATATLGMSTGKTSAHKLIELEGEIDLHRSPDVKQQLQAAIAEKPAKLMIDLSKVTYIDSSGLATLLEGMQGVEFSGGKFYLVAVQEMLRAIFETSKLDEVFRIVASVDAAEAAP